MKNTALWMFLLLLPVAWAACGHLDPKTPAAEPTPVTENDYRIFSKEGRPAFFSDIIAAAETTDVLFLGEEHGNRPAHSLQSKILNALHEALSDGKTPRRLVLSMEMFERDVQPVLDEYIADLITERHFMASARPWRNYRTDYHPLIEFAKANNIPVVAANAPGRYVNRVARLGRDALTDLPPEAMAWLPPLPYGDASDAYRAKFMDFWNRVSARGTHPEPTADGETPDGAFENLLSAQSLWDAAMADAIADTLKTHPGSLVVHITGKFHVEQGLGIPEHLTRYRSDARTEVVIMTAAESFPDFDPSLKGYGDFVVVANPETLGT